MKSSRSLLVIPVLAGSFLAFSCGAWTTGSGNLAKETRAVSGFHAVVLEGSATLDITQGDKEELVVEAEDNLLPLIETTVKPDGTLVLGFKRHEEVRTTKPVTFKLSVKMLDKMVLAGSGHIDVAGKLSAESETIQLPGSGTITLDRLETAGALTVSLEGSGKIKVAAGGATSQSIEVAGSGKYDATDFKTETTKIAVAGSGDCQVWSEKRLEVEISGSGAVAYFGHPELRQRVTGSGAVHSLGQKDS